jgi:hypothetical protein
MSDEIFGTTVTQALRTARGHTSGRWAQPQKVEQVRRRRPCLLRHRRTGKAGVRVGKGGRVLVRGVDRDEHQVSSGDAGAADLDVRVHVPQ